MTCLHTYRLMLVSLRSFGTHPAVGFHPKEFLEDGLAKLRWDAWADIRHGKMQDRRVPGPCILPGHRDPHDPACGEYFSKLCRASSRRTASRCSTQY